MTLDECVRFRNELDRMTRSEQGDGLPEQLKAHLSKCKDCLEWFEFHSSVQELLRRPPSPWREEFEGDLLAAMEREGESLRKWDRLYNDPEKAPAGSLGGLDTSNGPFENPPSVIVYDSWSLHIVHGEICGDCWLALERYGGYLAPLARRTKTITLIMGDADIPKQAESPVIWGHCACNAHKDQPIKIPGCPASSKTVRQVVSKFAGSR